MTAKICGKEFPVITAICVEKLDVKVPVINIRMMSDEREKELGAKSAEKWKELNRA